MLDFWFGAPDSRERGRPRKSWFEKSEAFDAEIRRRFLAAWERAARGELGPWQTTPLASLALVVTLDQLPRNMFRGTARAFDFIARAMPDVTFGAVSLQLKTLSRAGLVATRPEAQQRFYRARREALGPIAKTLENMWNDALWRLKLAAELEQSRRGPRRKN